jgi:hypothetical protein
MSIRVGYVLAGTALAALLGSTAAQAYPTLPVGAALTFMGTGASPKASFSAVAPTGWSGGSGLIFVDSNASFNQSAAGPVYLTTYANPLTGDLGIVNYVEADGNPAFESGFNTTLTGLTPGQTYTLSFYQGASQQTGFTGTTTNQWIVALGGSGFSVCYNCGGMTSYGTASTYSDPGASIAASQLMTVPTGTAVGFEYVSVNLTASASTQLLSFLAWGDDGVTVNLPPIAFLTGVNAAPGLVPEPAAWTMLIAGFAGVGAVARRKRSLRMAATA